MVRHHIKATKTKKANKAKRQKAEEEERKKNEQNLDRFAGSSDEEEENDDDDSSASSSYEDEKPPKPIESDNDDDNENDTDPEKAPSASNDEASSDEDEYDGPATTATTNTNDAQTIISQSNTPGPVGMAGAMSRILGLRAPPSRQKKHPSSSVVLSKTTTPLQRLRTKEQRELQESRVKRREKRAWNLSAMHVPLGMGVGGVGGGEGIGREVAMERIHRKVATRGVVALFNAISEHQREKTRRAAEAGLLGSSKHNKNNPEDVRAMTKHGFIDMLQKKGTTANDAGAKYVAVADGNDQIQPAAATSGGKAGKKGKKNSSEGWNALKDDFMMNSKMKDWDKQMSEEESFDESDSSGGEDEQDVARKKGGGGTRDLDDVMEGEISSSSDEE